MALIKELDTGTPIRVAERTRDPHHRRPGGDRAAGHVGDGGGDRCMGTQIPKLCATDMLEAFGSCRLCLVEIEGRQGNARLVHHAGRGRHGRAHADADASPSCARA